LGKQIVKDTPNAESDAKTVGTERSDYDGFWKDLINRFFYPLLKRAVPELYEKADIEKKHRFLETEFRDILKTFDRKKRQRPRFADLVIEVPLKNGGNAWILFHVEAQQGYGGGNIAERMNHYRSLIYSHYRKEPVALAIIAGSRRKKERFYSHSHYGTEIIYRYNNLVLAELDDGELQTSDNPIDLALYAAKCALRAKEELQKYTYLRTLMELLAERGWSKKDKDDLLFFLEWIIDLRDKDLEKKYVEYRNQLSKEGKIVYIRPGEREEVEEIKQSAKEEMARNLLANGVSPEVIAKSAGKPVEEIRKLKN